jgi:hypothetical protein
VGTGRRRRPLRLPPGGARANPLCRAAPRPMRIARAHLLVVRHGPHVGDVEEARRQAPAWVRRGAAARGVGGRRAAGGGRRAARRRAAGGGRRAAAGLASLPAARPLQTRFPCSHFYRAAEQLPRDELLPHPDRGPRSRPRSGCDGSERGAARPSDGEGGAQSGGKRCYGARHAGRGTWHSSRAGAPASGRRFALLRTQPPRVRGTTRGGGGCGGGGIQFTPIDGRGAAPRGHSRARAPAAHSVRPRGGPPQGDCLCLQEGGGVPVQVFRGGPDIGRAGAGRAQGSRGPGRGGRGERTEGGPRRPAAGRRGRRGTRRGREREGRGRPGAAPSRGAGGGRRARPRILRIGHRPVVGPRHAAGRGMGQAGGPAWEEGGG